MTDQAFARGSDPQTSHDAAASLRTLPLLEDTCFKAIRRAPEGLTSEELARATGYSLVTVSPRLRPLAEKGLIEPKGKRANLSGRQAIVWVAVQQQGRLF